MGSNMNKNYILAAVSFVLGVGSGFGGAYIYLKKKHEEKLAEEVDSLKKAYGRQLRRNVSEIISNDISEEDSANDENGNSDYVDMVDRLGYDGDTSEKQLIDYTSHYSKSDPVDEFPEDTSSYSDLPNDDPYRPRVISDEEYYDYEDAYERIEINLFENESDNTDYTLTDTAWEPLEEPFKVICKEDLENFIKQDEEDEIFTVCEGRRCVYSIMKQGQSWEEFLKNNPVIIETRY